MMELRIPIGERSSLVVGCSQKQIRLRENSKEIISSSEKVYSTISHKCMPRWISRSKKHFMGHRMRALHPTFVVYDN